MATATYTYHAGRKLPLSRVSTHFISRAGQQALLCDDFELLESLTPNAWTVRTNAGRLEGDLLRARRLGPAYPAYVVEDDGSAFLVTDRIFVRFRRYYDFEDAELHQFAAEHRLELLEQISGRDFLFRVDPALDVVDVVCALTEREQQVVDLVDHDLNVEPEPASTRIAAPFVAMQWYLLSTPPKNRLISSRSLVDCQGAWAEAGYGSSEVVISVVDCGCNLEDANFGEGKFAGWGILVDDRVETGAYAAARMGSPLSHGTLCATLAAASANGVGGLGAAPGCRLLPLKWEELGGTYRISQSAFARVIRFLNDKVDVVSCSWSAGTIALWPVAVTDALQASATTGGPRGNGIVWVWSAGNRNCPIQFVGDIPIPTTVRNEGTRLIVKTSRRFDNPFAGVPGVLHVGAISSLGQRCHYSNYGPGLDVVAPSDNRHLYGRALAVGAKIMAPRDRGLVEIGGTSAAAPLVAGIAGLVRSANPSLTAPKVASLLRRTADTDLVMNGYPPSGRPGDDPNAYWDVSPVPPYDCGRFRPIGHPDGDWSAWFGFGKVNARRAVVEALRVRQA